MAYSAQAIWRWANVLTAPPGEPTWVFNSDMTAYVKVREYSGGSLGSPSSLPAISAGGYTWYPSRIQSWMDDEGLRHLVVAADAYDSVSDARIFLFDQNGDWSSWATPTQIIGDHAIDPAIWVHPNSGLVLIVYQSGAAGATMRACMLQRSGGTYTVASDAQILYTTYKTLMWEEPQGRLVRISPPHGNIYVSTGNSGTVWSFSSQKTMGYANSPSARLWAPPGMDMVVAHQATSPPYQGIIVRKYPRTSGGPPAYGSPTTYTLGINSYSIGDMWVTPEGLAKMVYTDLSYNLQVLTSDLSCASWS